MKIINRVFNLSVIVVMSVLAAMFTHPGTVEAAERETCCGASAEPRDSFDREMARSGWSVNDPQNRHYFNVQNIIRRQEILDLEQNVNIRVYSAKPHLEDDRAGSPKTP